MNPYKDKKYKITQGYSKMHTGIDIVGIESKDIYSVCAGTVSYKGYENPNNKKQGFGLYIRILGDDGYYYYYGHLNYVEEFLKVGDRVDNGTYLGVEGNTGSSTGNHLHFEIRKKIGVLGSLENSINVEQLLLKNDSKINKVNEVNKKNNIYAAIDILSINKKIDSPDFWKVNYDTRNNEFNKNVLKYVGDLLMKWARDYN